MIEYILEDGTVETIEPENEEQFKLDNPTAKLKSNEPENQEINQSQNNQQENIEIEKPTLESKYLKTRNAPNVKVDYPQYFFNHDKKVWTKFDYNTPGFITEFKNEEEMTADQDNHVIYNQAGQNEKYEFHPETLEEVESENKRLRAELEERYRKKILGQWDSSTDLSHMSIEDLKFKIENPLSTKTENNEIIKTDADGTSVVDESGKKIEKWDKSEEAKDKVEKTKDSVNKVSDKIEEKKEKAHFDEEQKKIDKELKEKINKHKNYFEDIVGKAGENTEDYKRAKRALDLMEEKGTVAYFGSEEAKYLEEYFESLLHDEEKVEQDLAPPPLTSKDIDFEVERYKKFVMPEI